MDVIVKTEPIPLYYQLKEILRKAIESGKLKAAERLPSEQELCNKYQVSRITVRKALDFLVNKGFIFREHGKGTFVSAATARLEQPPKVISFSEELKRRGFLPTTKILAAKLIKDKKIAQKLSLDLSKEIVFIKRLRLADGEPLALETSYLPHKFYPEILAEDLAKSLTKITEEKYRLRLSRAKQTVKACLANKQESKLLNIPYRAPVLVISRISYLSNNQPIEYLEGIYRGDRYELTTELRGR